MKTQLLPAIKLTLLCMLFFVGAYTTLIWGVGQVIAPNLGKGETLNYGNPTHPEAYGFANIGQSFTDENYFWSRPSAVGYNAAGSGASNKGSANAEYLSQVQARLDTFMLHNPTVKKSAIPVEMITASGSGLDPHISPKAALVQVARIALIRNIAEAKIKSLVDEHTEQPLLGLFGPSRINVLKLNIALDHLK